VGVVSAEFEDWEVVSWMERCGEHCWSMNVVLVANDASTLQVRFVINGISVGRCHSRILDCHRVVDTRNITISPTFLAEIFSMRDHQGGMNTT
jgi:hypothetical protein